jgi:hypothetical protein
MTEPTLVSVSAAVDAPKVSAPLALFKFSLHIPDISCCSSLLPWDRAVAPPTTTAHDDLPSKVSLALLPRLVGSGSAALVHSWIQRLWTQKRYVKVCSNCEQTWTDRVVAVVPRESILQVSIASSRLGSSARQQLPGAQRRQQLSHSANSSLKRGSPHLIEYSARSSMK